MEPSPSIDDSRRFSLATSDDHAGQLWIVTILSLIYTGLVALARAYIKYQMYGFDDILFALATVRTHSICLVLCKKTENIILT